MNNDPKWTTTENGTITDDMGVTAELASENPRRPELAVFTVGDVGVYAGYLADLLRGQGWEVRPPWQQESAGTPIFCCKGGEHIIIELPEGGWVIASRGGRELGREATLREAIAKVESWA